MKRRAALLLLGIILLPAAAARALDVPLDADGLQLRRTPGGREVLELEVRDRSLGVPERRSADDPSVLAGDGALLELFGGDGSTAAFFIPGGEGEPGWRVRDPHDSKNEQRNASLQYRYLNPFAPDGPTSVKLLRLQERQGLLIVGREVGLPLDVPMGRVGVRLTLGTLRLCALFDETTVVRDKPGRFAARRASAAVLPDCSDEWLRTQPLPPETTTTTTTTPPTSTSTSTTSTSTSTSSTTSTTLVTLTFGHATEFAGASSHSPGFLLGSPVQVSTPITVTHLAVIAKAGGPRVLLGLYRNSGGVPTTLVVGTAPTQLVPGRVEMPVTPTPIAAGTYWLMAMYDGDASVGLDTSVPNAPAMYDFRDFAQGLPSSVSFPSSMFGQRYNYYLIGTP
ncbi:MAG TPA: hypothetical protein VNO26_04130 [Candidatus Limnocylindria bacterium]|nr:hypothetical protein [Candidatus Limnocylindria bacterium]